MISVAEGGATPLGIILYPRGELLLAMARGIAAAKGAARIAGVPMQPAPRLDSCIRHRPIQPCSRQLTDGPRGLAVLLCQQIGCIL